MSYWEVINPSDQVVFEAGELEIAAITTILLGSGSYGAEEQVENGRKVPLFLFEGAAGLDAWCDQEFGKTWEQLIENVVNERSEELENALRSLVYGGAAEARQLNETWAQLPPEEARVARARWNDTRRSSLNNIGARAEQIADNVRKKRESACEPS